jgi:regulator of protease activity HflC (stomatin/prohibitin superfamily)
VLLAAPLTGACTPAPRSQFYKLTNSHSQISSYVFDVVRASVPKMNLDDVFLEKEAIARSIRNVSAATRAKQ